MVRLYWTRPINKSDWSGYQQDNNPLYFESNNVGTASQQTSSVGNYKYGDLNFNASRGNKIYGNAITVQPASMCTQYLIKY